MSDFPGSPAATLWQIDPHGSVRLSASRQKNTGTVYFPPLPAESPLMNDFETISLSPTGRLYTFTIIHPNPKSGRQPFALAYVDFPENVRVFGRLAMAAETRPKIGMAVNVDIFETDEGSQRYLFREGTSHGC